MACNIRALRIESYTSIRRADVELGDLTVLIGPNGAGKSNFIAAFGLLGYIADGRLALEVGRAGGAGALLCSAPGAGDRMVLDVQGATFGYRAELERASNDQLFFSRESVWFEPHGGGPDREYFLGEGHRETALWDADGKAAIAAAKVRAELGGCRVYHFQDTSMDAAVKRYGQTADTLALHADASNLAPFLMSLRAESPGAYRRILRTVRAVAPFFDDFVLTEEGSGKVRLRWRQQGAETVFGAEALSDGSLRFICLAVLLLQPDPPELLVLDEPELGLHPAAIVHLAEMLRAASVTSQVVVATQSVTLLDQMSLEEVVVVERQEGGSVFIRPDETRLRAWTADYSLGELWLKNLIGGRPAREWTDTEG